MNIVTGVFVGSALHTAEEENRKMSIQQVAQFWANLSRDGSGDIALDEFQEKLYDPTMAKLFEDIDLGTDDASDLFLLIDSDNSGCVTIEELLSGCLRLKGNAKA